LQYRTPFLSHKKNMKWNGRTYRPAGAQFIKKKKEFDFEEALKPYGQKEMPVWNSVVGVNVPPIQPSPTPSITATATPGATPTQTPSNTPSVTPSQTPSQTPSVTPSITASNTPSVTPSITPSVTPSITPTNTPSVTPSNTPSVTPSQTPSNTPSTTPSQTPSNTPSVTPSITASITPTNTPTPSTTPPASGTTEANAYLSAVVTAGGTLDATISAATVTLFTSLVSAGIWDTLQQFYPLLGGVAASNAIEGKSATSKITWNGGMTFSSSGAKSNGTNAYGNIAYNENTLAVLNDFHMSFYSNQATAADDGLALGVTQSGHRTSMYWNDATTDGGAVVQTSASYALDTTSSTALGFYVGTRTSSILTTFYQNAVSQATSAGASTQKTNGNFYVFARNNVGLATPDAFTNKRCAFVSLGLSLTAGQVTSLQNAVHTFNTTLGRNY
jgi:hypothetical protein